MSVMNMYQNAVKEYDDVMEKRRTVTKDKEKIERVIAELDVKKNEALEKTWTQVNKDFGSIFKTLLPGTDAKLSPPEGLSIWDGLEVKVRMINVRINKQPGQVQTSQRSTMKKIGNRQA